MIIDHTHPEYIIKRNRCGMSRWNGAYYYSNEIVKNIIPRVETDRNWITVNIEGVGCDHSIVFIHNNLNPQNYEWLKRYKDLILVCGIPETVDKVKHIGKAIYLPISIDVDEVKRYKTDKIKGSVAYAGRRSKRKDFDIPEGVDILEGMERTNLLKAMARHEYIYAVGRTALEAKALGCKLLPYDERFPKVSRWKVLDNKKAAKMLQGMLDEIDG